MLNSSTDRARASSTMTMTASSICSLQTMARKAEYRSTTIWDTANSKMYPPRLDWIQNHARSHVLRAITTTTGISIWSWLSLGECHYFTTKRTGNSKMQVSIYPLSQTSRCARSRGSIMTMMEISIFFWVATQKDNITVPRWAMNYGATMETELFLT